MDSRVEPRVILAIGLEVGSCTRAEAEEWLDREVAKYERPPDELLDLYPLSRVSEGDIAKGLLSLGPEPSPTTVRDLELGFLAAALGKPGCSIDHAINLGLQITFEDDEPRDLHGAFAELDAAYSLAAEGIHGDLDDVAKGLAEALKPYGLWLEHLRAERIIEIDGARFSSLEGFFDEFARVALDGQPWGRNFDAFDDVLRGGFGTPDGGFVLRWKNHPTSRERLGYPEPARVLRARLERCDEGNRESFAVKLAAAESGRGPSVFDDLISIVREHGLGGEEAEDRVVLELA